MPNESESRLLVWAVIASQFGPPFMFSGVAVALPHMGAELRAGATALGLVETLFLGGSIAFLLPVGRLADAGDKRTLYKLGLLGFCATSVLIGVISSVQAILAIRFLQGLMSAICAVTGPAILADVVPPERRGRAFGRSLGAIYAGLSLGPILAGYLVEQWGWRSVFIFGAVIIGLGLLLIQRLLPSAWRPPESLAHLSSALLWIPAVLCVVAGSALLRTGVWAYVTLGFGLALAVFFVLLQRRLKHPLLDVDRLVGNRVLRSALAIQLLVYLNAFSALFMLSLYLQVSLGQSARTAGQVLAIGSVLMALLAPFAGTLADRYRPRVLSSIGVACVFVSTLLAVRFDAETSVLSVTGVLAIQGLGFALFSSPNMTLIMGSVPRSDTSMASAFAAKARGLGMLSGMLLTTILISLQIGSDPVSQHPVRFIGTMTATFAILAALVGMALLLSVLTTGRERRRAQLE